MVFKKAMSFTNMGGMFVKCIYFPVTTTSYNVKKLVKITDKQNNK